MKTFEEKFTAWIDGRLIGAELAAFERELESHPEALAEKESLLELGDLLRTHLSAPPLRNPDFFNHQLLEQIRASQPAAVPAQARPAYPSFWSLPRMAFSGGLLLVLALGLYFAAVPNTLNGVRHREQYVSNILNATTHDPDITANVLNARSDDPNITATSFHSKEENVNVVWLDGLNYIPRDHKLK